jgi:rhomboid-like protein
VPIAFETVASIIAINAMVFVAWRIPLPITWRTLNRYFMSVPALPYSFSILGSVFSHQTLSHLGMNMFVLYVFGTSLCEQIGSGPFVGLYLSGGVLSSLASLTYNVVRQRFHVCSLGASGAISALVGAYAYINPDTQLYVIFLPFFALKAKYFISVLAAVEALGIVRGWQVMDHVAHLGGLAWGVGFGYALIEEYNRRLERKREELKKKGFGW